jgi:glycosyltransferase involved in cell wall biosynthesis
MIPPAARPHDKTIEISVVICTRDRVAHLERTLATLARQEAPVAWETVVVDNGSRDGTAVRVAELADGFPVPLRLAAEHRYGLAHARNHGLNRARGEVVIFIDDDVNCRPGWLLKHAEVFRDSTVGGAGGKILPLLPPETPQWFHDLLPHEIGGPTSRYDFGDEPRDIGLSMPPPFGANMAVRRHLALAVGGFRTDLGWGPQMIPSEEMEFFARVRALGVRLCYVPEAVVEHRIDPARVTRQYYLTWQRGYGRSKFVIAPVHGIGQRLRSARQLVKEIWRLRRQAGGCRRGGDGIGALIAVREQARHEGLLLATLGL